MAELNEYIQILREYIETLENSGTLSLNNERTDRAIATFEASIKALNQQMTLDDIRIEVTDLVDVDAYGDYRSGVNVGIMQAAQVIDKYR